MKKSLFFLFCILGLNAKSQLTHFFYDAQFNDSVLTKVFQYNPNPFFQKEYTIREIEDTTAYRLFSDYLVLHHYVDRNDGTPASILWLDDSLVMASPISEFNLPYSQLTSVPSTFAPSSHTHPQSQITNLSDSLLARYTKTQANNRFVQLSALFPVPTVIGSGARNFNQAYQVSSTRPARISISPQIACALTLSGGQAGNIQLQISPNGSTGWITVGQLSGSNTGTLTIGLATTDITGCQLTVDLPIGYYWRASTTNTTGTPTFTFNNGFEITY